MVGIESRRRGVRARVAEGLCVMLRFRLAGSVRMANAGKTRALYTGACEAMMRGEFRECYYRDGGFRFR